MQAETVRASHDLAWKDLNSFIPSGSASVQCNTKNKGHESTDALLTISALRLRKEAIF